VHRICISSYKPAIKEGHLIPLNGTGCNTMHKDKREDIITISIISTVIVLCLVINALGAL
jgi:hypothetical protein